VKSRTIATFLTLALMAAGTGGVIAGNHGDAGNGNASKSQYRPGKGCGDKNHVHARHDECKKDGNDHGNGGGDDHGNGGGDDHGKGGDDNGKGNGKGNGHH
jgi:hypothetical protein